MRTARLRVDDDHERTMPKSATSSQSVTHLLLSTAATNVTNSSVHLKYAVNHLAIIILMLFLPILQAINYCLTIVKPSEVERMSVGLARRQVLKPHHTQL